MLARPKIVTGSNARNYFEKDTYYLNNEFEQGSFYGKLKDDFGLTKFNLKDFDYLLKAQNPRTGEHLLRLQEKDLDENSERKRAALDLTFAADKSISILYEVSDKVTKEKIREAFTKSIDEALDFVEANYANSKSRDNLRGDGRTEPKLLFTRFDHSESRNNDMHLHQHCLMINMVQDKNGQYKSIEFNQTMMNHQLIGQIQRNVFAQELQKLGYEVLVTNAKVGSFALKNIDKEIREKFSTRSKDIKDEMQANGQTSYKATHTAQKQTAKWKDKNKDREAIQGDNIKRLIEANADINQIQQISNDLKIRNMTAKSAVAISIDDLTDKQSVFSREDILKHSLKVGLTSNLQLSAIEKEFQQYQDLITIDKNNNQFTTLEVLKKEEYIFSKNENKNFKITDNQNVVNAAIKEFESKKGFKLKKAQNKLANIILTSEKQFILAQGVAGAGKSTSLEIIKNVVERTSTKIIALAPTGTATDNLSKEAGIKESYTVAKFIQTNGKDIKDAIIIIDEAGMLGLRDTNELIKIAEKNNLKLIFSGDKNQKKSISQGDIFAGMQRQGFETVYLDEGNRQKNDKMRNAVQAILDKDMLNALNILKDTTKEIINTDERLVAAQNEYLKDRHNSLLITTTNVDRQKLNKTIRNSLVLKKEILGSKSFETREIPTMSVLEKRSAIYYQAGEKVYLSKNIGHISAGREATILDVDIQNNTLIIQHQGKNKIFTEQVNLSTQGNQLNLFKETKIELGIGEQIIAKKNDSKLGIKNGQIGEVTNIKNDVITVKFDKKEMSFNIKQYPYIQHAYAITDFASQGKTTDKVVAVVNSQSASFNDFYTQITRAKFEAHIITDDLKELQIRATRDSIKLNASELISQNQITQKDINMQSSIRKNIVKLTQEEFTHLAKKTKSELKLTDPAPVLNALGIEYKVKAGRYEFKARNDEKTASANLYIDKAGEWKYKDFGSGNNGTVENLIMDTTGASYKEALEYAITHSNVRDYVQERLDEFKGSITNKKEVNLNLKRAENLIKVESQINSKIIGIKEVISYAPAVQYLKSRSIIKIPPQFKMITGEYINKAGDIKKAFGVGIQTLNNKGADIHFLKQVGSLKTMNFGEKNISYFKSSNPNNLVAIFESKMDYAAAYQQIEFSNIDIVIANSTSSFHKVAKIIKDRYSSIQFYNQNDKAGIQFVKDVTKNANITDFKYIKYEKQEQGQDIKDLIINNINLEKRQEVSFIGKIKNKYKDVDKKIIDIENKQKLNKGEFYRNLLALDKNDVLNTFDFLNENLSDKVISGVMKASKEVTNKQETTLLGTTKFIIEQEKVASITYNR